MAKVSRQGNICKINTTCPTYFVADINWILTILASAAGDHQNVFDSIDAVKMLAELNDKKYYAAQFLSVYYNDVMSETIKSTTNILLDIFKKIVTVYNNCGEIMEH